MNHSQIVSCIWGVADLIRDPFKRGKYQDVILPLTVLRRLDCVLAPTKRKVLEVQARFAGRIDNLDPQLRRASGFAFYNTSRYDFEKLLADAPHIAQNLRNYIAGFSPNMREVLEKFDFDNTIAKLDESGLLFQVMQRCGDPQVNLHPDAVDNATMGTIFEKLIRKFNEALNENPGEHFTPRDVVHLMVDLLLAGDEERLRTKGVVLRASTTRVAARARHAHHRQGAHHRRRDTRRRTPRRCRESGRRHAPLRPGGEPGDLRHLQVGSLHEVGGRPRRGEHPVREHALERPARRRRLRLPSRSTRRTPPCEIACSFGKPFWCRRAAMSASVASRDMVPPRMIYARQSRCQVPEGPGSAVAGRAASAGTAVRPICDGTRRCGFTLAGRRGRGNRCGVRHFRQPAFTNGLHGHRQ